MTFLISQLLLLLVRYANIIASASATYLSFLVLEKSASALSQESDWVKESVASHLPTVNDGETTVTR